MPRRGLIGAILLAAIVLVAGLIVLGLAGDFLVDLLWFREVGYVAVFWTVLAAKSAVFAVAFAGSAVVLGASGMLAFRMAVRRRPWQPPPFDWQSVPPGTLPDALQLVRRHVPRYALVGVLAAVVAAVIGAAEVPNWDVFLRALYHVPYGRDDPLYGNDIGFYLFVLPALVAVKNWLFATFLLAAGFAVAAYWLEGDIVFDSQRPFVSRMSSTASTRPTPKKFAHTRFTIARAK